MRLRDGVFVSLLVVGAVQAQTPLGRLDLAALGYEAATVQPIEADGDPATIELLAVRHADGWYSVGRPSCAGPWFNPRAGVSWWSSITVGMLNGRHVLLVRDYGSTALDAIALHAPTC